MTFFQKREIVETSQQDTLDLLTTISNSWELYMCNISTDEEKYYFTGADLSDHNLRALTFNNKVHILLQIRVGQETICF